MEIVENNVKRGEGMIIWPQILFKDYKHSFKFCPYGEDFVQKILSDKPTFTLIRVLYRDHIDQ